MTKPRRYEHTKPVKFSEEEYNALQRASAMGERNAWSAEGDISEQQVGLLRAAFSEIFRILSPLLYYSEDEMDGDKIVYDK